MSAQISQAPENSVPFTVTDIDRNYSYRSNIIGFRQAEMFERSWRNYLGPKGAHLDQDSSDYRSEEDVDQWWQSRTQEEVDHGMIDSHDPSYLITQIGLENSFCHDCGDQFTIQYNPIYAGYQVCCKGCGASGPSRMQIKDCVDAYIAFADIDCDLEEE